MPARKQEINLQFWQIVDGVVLAVVLWAAHTLRFYATSWFSWDRPIQPFSEFRWLLFIIMPFGPLMLEMQSFYVYPLQKNAWRSFGQIMRAAFWLCLFIGICVIFFHLPVPSRAVLLVFAAFATVVLLARERLAVAHLKRRAKTGKFRENVMLAGTPIDIEQIRKTFASEQFMEMEIVGEIDIESEPVSVLVACLHKHSVSRVIFAGGHAHLNRIEVAIRACEIEGVEAWLVADFIRTSIARPTFDVMGNRPMLVFRTTPEASWALIIKAAIDRVGAFILLLLTWPIFIGAAVGIKLTSPGPIIFRQTRAGRHGKPFTMLKFRTMNTNAEMRRAELEAFNEMSGPVFKVENDPRVTKFGRWLRKTSVDELPQLINVLRGQMSLVGPRPLPVYEVEKFANTAQRRRLSVKPGLTCLWQVSGRSDVRDFHEWVRLDLSYIDNWSIWLDLKILLKTIPAVILGFGAR